jgi:hypothetical protein
MIQLALLTGLGLLGYILATQSNRKPQPKETFLSPRRTDQFNDQVQLTQTPQGHNNMVPFFGARVTQNLQGGANNGVLDSHAGTGKEFFQKREIASLYDVVPGVGIPFGNQNESDFYQSRQVAGSNMKNVFPIEKQRVGPGLNDGYTDIPSGGYQQFNELQQYAKPRTTDEIRVANKPKLSYDMPVIPGSHYITNPGLQAPVNKNRPDTFQVLTRTEADGSVSMPYLLTTGGAQVAPASFPAQIQKEQERETTSVEYYGSGGASFTFSSYIRAFTEPFEQFMKLTVGEWFGTGGGSGGAYPEGTYLVDQYLAAYTNPGREASVLTNYQAPGYTALNTGSDNYGATKTNKDEDMLINVRQFVDPANVVPTSVNSQQIGVQKFNEPLQQDVEVTRMDPGILDAFRNNPYTQSLTSVA